MGWLGYESARKYEDAAQPSDCNSGLLRFGNVLFEICASAVQDRAAVRTAQPQRHERHKEKHNEIILVKSFVAWCLCGCGSWDFSGRHRRIVSP